MPTPTPYAPVRRFNPASTGADPVPTTPEEVQLSPLRGVVVEIDVNKPILSQRLVAIVNSELVYYTTGVGAQAHALLGVTLTGNDGTGTVLVQTRGGAYIPDWGLTPEATYVAGSAGELQINSNTAGVFQRVIGRAISPNTLLLAPLSPIFTST